MKVFLLCSSHNDLGLIYALRKLGAEIVVSGNRADLPGQRLCDKYIPGDYSDKNAMLEIAMSEKIDAVCACCNDFGVYTAAFIAEKLGLPGYDSYETTLTLHNKDLFKKFALANGIQTPRSESFSTVEDAERQLETFAFPIIVKPTDCSAGNGIQKVETVAQAKDAVRYAFSKSRAGRIVIEPFVHGSQHGFCTFLKDRRVVAVCSNNEFSFANPYRVEIDTYPADITDQTRKFLVAQIEKIAHLLSLADGVFHLQYIMDGDRPMIIEVMRRILGNMYHVPGNWLTGLDWEYWQVRQQCGLGLEGFPLIVPQEGCFAYKAILAQEDGTVSDVQIPTEYMPYLRDKYFLKKRGDKIKNHLSDPIGFLFFTFPNVRIMNRVLIENYRDDLVALTRA